MSILIRRDTNKETNKQTDSNRGKKTVLVRGKVGRRMGKIDFKRRRRDTKEFDLAPSLSREDTARKWLESQEELTRHQRCQTLVLGSGLQNWEPPVRDILLCLLSL